MNLPKSPCFQPAKSLIALNRHSICNVCSKKYTLPYYIFCNFGNANFKTQVSFYFKRKEPRIFKLKTKNHTITARRKLFTILETIPHQAKHLAADENQRSRILLFQLFKCHLLRYHTQSGGLTLTGHNFWDYNTKDEEVQSVF